jgi:hypothetical protein
MFLRNWYVESERPPARPPMEDQELTKAILILANVLKNSGSYMGGEK